MCSLGALSCGAANPIARASRYLSTDEVEVFDDFAEKNVT